MTFERAKTRLERGLPEKAPKKPKKGKVRHDAYDPGHMTSYPGHPNGGECPYPGCYLPVFDRATKDTVKPCPLGRGCETIPARFV